MHRHDYAIHHTLNVADVLVVVCVVETVAP